MNFRDYDCIVDGTIEQCIEEIEVGDLGEHIYYGPQAEVMEELQRFNSRHLSNLEITKTFKWKRGSYQRVSELMMEGLGFNRKPSGMYNYLSREDWFRNSTWDSIRRTLRTIDGMLYNLRGQGEVWLDDPGILVERKNLYANYMSEKIEMADELINNIDIMQEMYHQLFVHPTSRSSQRYMLVSTLRIRPGTMKVYITSGRDSQREAKHIENIACDTDLYINNITYPLRTMTANSNYDNPRFSVQTLGQVEQPDDKGYLAYPFISGSRQWRTNGLFGNNVCYGDQSNEIYNALCKYDMTSFVLQSVNWATTYTNITGPHNNIKQMYHGEPAKLSEEYRKVFGTNDMRHCNYEPDGDNDYCDVQECTFRSQCPSYKNAHPEPVTPEQAEQMTLQWATRMGGVNHAAPTVIHTTDSEGNPISVTRDPISNEQRVENDQPDWLPGEQSEEQTEEFLETLRQHINERNEEE
jgi:hypothetical protein